jgi:hypothetical protein
MRLLDLIVEHFEPLTVECFSYDLINLKIMLSLWSKHYAMKMYGGVAV